MCFSSSLIRGQDTEKTLLTRAREIADRKEPRETGEKLAHRDDRTSGGALMRGSRAGSRDFVKRWAKANSSRMSAGTFARRLTNDPMTSCGGRLM